MPTCSPDAIREPLLARIASGLRSALLFGLFSLLGGCSTVGTGSGVTETGMASYYGARHHGNKTASGERFDQHALTAAHRSLPFGSRVQVTNLRNNKRVVVRINDRGPYAKQRIIDLSQKAAEQLDMLRDGVVPVRIEQLVD
jgi:rare lipoprotein A